MSPSDWRKVREKAQKKTSGRTHLTRGRVAEAAVLPPEDRNGHLADARSLRPPPRRCQPAEWVVGNHDAESIWGLPGIGDRNVAASAEKNHGGEGG